jgi:hypothetical protein
MSSTTNRRDFLRNTTLASTGFWVAGSTVWAESKSPNEKLDIGVIGAGGKGASDTKDCSSENIVALCDVDDKSAGETFKKFPKAKRYRDFREMLEKEKLDAVIVSTPDHIHAVAAVTAMKLGKHVFVQKPLTHDIYEARVMRETAAKYKVATQMGNQGTATEGLRRAAELIQAGAIGPVKDVHIWTNRPIWDQGDLGLLRHSGVRATLHDDKPANQPVPSHMAWDLWIGPAPFRPYDACYAPWHWRGWWDFGTGAVGDMACHTANMPYMALKLGAPTTVEAESAPINPETYPVWSTLRYQFPARADMPPVNVTWYDGSIGRKQNLPPADLWSGLKLDKSGSLLIGEKGMLYSPGSYAEQIKLLPEEKFRDYKGPEPTIPRSPGHHKEWILACKGGPKAMSNFDYAGPLTEAMLLGLVALRTGKRIEWDPVNLKAKGCPEADPVIRREYRKGWSL